MSSTTQLRTGPGTSQRSTEPRSAARSLAELDARQGDLLLALQDPASVHAEMLTALMVSNSLLELSKLATARLNLAEFSRAALTTVVQCTPVTACALYFSAPDVPPVHESLGSWVEPPLDDTAIPLPDAVVSGDQVCSPVFGADRNAPIGYFGVTGAPRGLVDAGLVDRASDQISSMLGLLIEAERLRRAAAASEAMEMVSALGDDYGEADLFELASTFASLPGAEAARIFVEISRFGGPIMVESGNTDEEITHSERVDEIDRNAKMTLHVWWTGGAAPSDNRLDAITDRLVVSLARAEQTAKLRAEVETDELTGIGNRRRGSRALAQAAARSQRSGEEFAIFMMDLDKFKSVNDEFGHEMGDSVLRLFAEAIEAVVRGYDVAARWGGEEFLLVCPGTGRSGSEALAKRLLEKTPDMCSQALPEGRLQTVSIGIAVCENSSCDPQALLRSADEAMYQAKTTGRNKFIVAEPARRVK